jgi:dihydrofolate reductase
MSLDGFVAGLNQTLEQPLGEGGEGLHEWALGLASFRDRHGMDGGEAGGDDEVMKESLAAQGAVVMGRRMFSGGAGPWEDDPNADGWWGDEPPFRVPVFILTHHAREPVTKQGGTTFTFVTDGIEPALEQARAAAGDRDVLVAGGADAVQQYLRAGCSTSSRSTSSRCFSAAAFACSTISATPGSGWSSTGWSIPPPSPTSGTGSSGPSRG